MEGPGLDYSLQKRHKYDAHLSCSDTFRCPLFADLIPCSRLAWSGRPDRVSPTNGDADANLNSHSNRHAGSHRHRYPFRDPGSYGDASPNRDSRADSGSQLQPDHPVR